MQKTTRILWKDKEVDAMLCIIKEKNILELLDRKKRRNKSIFETVGKEMKERNIEKSALQIRAKFKSLKFEYFKAKRNNNTSESARVTCSFYNTLDEIFSTRPSVGGIDGVDTSDVNMTDKIFNDLDDNSPTDFVEISIDQEPEKVDALLGPSTISAHVESMSSFTNEWKKMQDDQINYMKRQDDLFVQEMEKQRAFEEELLKKDREETSKMLQNFCKIFAVSIQSQCFPHGLGYQPLFQHTFPHPQYNSNSSSTCLSSNLFVPSPSSLTVSSPSPSPNAPVSPFKDIGSSSQTPDTK